MPKIRLKKFQNGQFDIDVAGMRADKKRKTRRKVFIFTLATLIGGIAYADYYLPDGSLVKWAGGNNVVIVKNGRTSDPVSATTNSDGRLVPTSGLSSSQKNDTNKLGSQYSGGDNRFNQNTGLSVPVFTNGNLTGYSNVYHDSSGLGRTYYTQNNSAGGTGSKVIDGANGSSADFNWSRVDLSSGSQSGTSSGSSGNNPSRTVGSGSSNNTGGSNYTPTPPPPRYAIDSFEISHNSAWEQARIRKSRQINQFYAGEPLEVKVTGSNIQSASAQFLLGSPSQDLPNMLLVTNDRRPSFEQTIQLNNLQGEGWLKHWAMIPDGNYTVRLTVSYKNGQTATKDASVQILGSMMDKLQPGGTDF